MVLVARAQWAFQVLQGSVETLFRWVGKRLHHFIANLFRKPCQISWESPEVCLRYHQKHFGLFFSGHTVLLHQLRLWELVLGLDLGFWYLSLLTSLVQTRERLQFKRILSASHGRSESHAFRIMHISLNCSQKFIEKLVFVSIFSAKMKNARTLSFGHVSVVCCL